MYTQTRIIITRYPPCLTMSMNNIVHKKDNYVRLRRRIIGSLQKTTFHYMGASFES